MHAIICSTMNHAIISVKINVSTVEIYAERIEQKIEDNYIFSAIIFYSLALNNSTTETNCVNKLQKLENTFTQAQKCLQLNTRK